MMRFYPIIISILLAGTLFAEAHPHRGILKAYSSKPSAISLSKAEQEELKNGQAVLKLLENSGKSARAAAVQDINAPKQAVWAKILAFNSYPKMVENVKSCEVYEKNGQHIKARFVIGSMGLKYEYFIDHIYDAANSYMIWTLDYDRKSEIDDSVGFWMVEEHPDDPNRSRVYYSVQFALNGWVPGFIKKMIEKKGLVNATAWVKREAER